MKLFRTEAPGYVLAVRRRKEARDHHWVAHTPARLAVAGLFDRYVRENDLDPAALNMFADLVQTVMLQAPELDEMVQWSSVVANDQ